MSSSDAEIDFLEKLISQKDRNNKTGKSNPTDVESQQQNVEIERRQQNVEIERRQQNVEIECRTVRVFISSTFKDFFNEREVLVKTFFKCNN